jgi:hypothetical protein
VDTAVPAPRRRTLERCQFENSFYRYAFPFNCIRGVVHTLQLLVGHRVEDRDGVELGEPSRFQVGDWVRVKDAAEIRATLDSNDELRGRKFLSYHRPYSGRTYRVERVIRRRPTHAHRMEKLSRTVALEGAICDAPDGSIGCGHACSLFFVDEWLEPSRAEETEPRTFPQTARVKPYDEIAATLDAKGRLDGISFSPEMAAYAGREFPVVRQVEEAWVTLPDWKQPRAAFFILDGVRCSGQPRGGHCDRNCGLFWHQSWLEMDEPATTTLQP